MEDKTPLPPTQMVVFGGHPDGITTKDRDARVRQTEQALSMLYLPTGNSITTRWDRAGVDRLLVVRESHRHIYDARHMEMNGFSQVVMPDKEGRIASDRREWVRVNVARTSRTVRIQSDGDIQKVGTNLTYGDKWLTDPFDLSEFIGAWVLQFQHDNLDYAGFNDRENRPGIVPHIYPGHPIPASYGRAYFKETLTFESGKCPGRYPQGWRFKEGAFRILDTVRAGGRTARFFPTALYETRSPDEYETEEADRKSTAALIREFGPDWVLQSRGKGLGLQAYGVRRNRKRRELKNG